MRVGPRTVALGGALMVLVGCPERWDPERPPGVSSAGGDSSGDEGEANAEGDENRTPPTELALSDQQIEGELAPGDHVLSVDGTLYDEFAFATVQGASVVVTMRSEAFEPYLHLVGPDGRQVAHGGAPPGESTEGVAELIVVAPVAGEYRIYANAVGPEMRGAYQLRLVVQDPPSPRE